jgi:2-iminobutanoate/2-iminopropanoate deaminase
MDLIASNTAPAAVGPYSQAVRVGGVVYCSGQIPLKIDGTMVKGGIREQAAQVLENLGAVLGSAGSGMSKAVKCTVYLTDMGNFAVMNEVYAEYFRDHKPARVTIQVSRLPKDALIEIDCIAIA